MPPLLNLSFKGNKPCIAFNDLCGTDSLIKTLKVCTRVAGYLEQGQRLKNLSWRLWHLQSLMVNLSPAKSKFELTKPSKVPGKVDKEKGRHVREVTRVGKTGVRAVRCKRVVAFPSPEIRSNNLADMDAVVVKLQGASKAEEKARLLALRDESALSVLNGCQNWLAAHREDAFWPKLLGLQVKIATLNCRLPQRVFITGVKIQSRDPTKYGGYADIFRGTWKGKPVALKRLRIESDKDTQKLFYKRLCQEGLIWQQLQHPNILPFYGMDKETFRVFSMISPWAERGTLMQYILSFDYNPEVDRLRLLLGICEGLIYLHGRSISHGDLHGANILITQDRIACLVDFGLAVLGDMTLSSRNIAGAARWMAPEHASENVDIAHRRPSGDVFSFGRVCLAICTKGHPFREIAADIAVLLRLAQDERPARPDEADCHGFAMPNALWALANECWAMDPLHRPGMLNVVALLRSLQANSFCPS